MKLAIIGCGAQGTAFAAAAAKLGLDITVCADVVHSRAQRLARAYGARSTTRARDAYAARDAEAVAICSPTDAHADQIMRAANAGRHVYCAAPLALSAKDARNALDAAAKAGTACYVAYDTRVCPALGHARRQAAQGTVGKVGFIRAHRAYPMPGRSQKWYRDYARSGGALATALAQDMAWIIEEYGPVEKVFAQSLQKPRLDYALVTLTLKTGAIVQLIGSWALPGGATPSAEIEFCGSAGMVSCQLPSAPLEWLPRTSFSDRPSTKVRGPLAKDVEVRHLIAFTESASASSKTRVSRDLELHIVSALEAAATAARTGKPVRG